MWSLLLVRAYLVLLLSSGSSSSLAFLVGDLCGVDSADFLTYEFLGKARVAGNGCTSQDGSSTDCFCAPDLDNQERLSEWKWKCGETVQFGPKGDKVCPDNVPVPKPQGISIGFIESQLGLPVPCDVSVNPTGHRGDEVCSYSECETTGGSFSAVCGCVDLTARGIENGGMVWICLHSTCSCDTDERSSGDVGSSAAVYHPGKGAVAGTFLTTAVLVAMVLAHT